MRWLSLTLALLLGGCTACPTLHLDRGRLLWQDVPVGQTESRTLVIDNLCADDDDVEVGLQIVLGAPFALDQSSVTVASGTPTAVEVLFTPTDAETHLDTLILYPGVLDQVEIALEGWGAVAED